MENSEIDINNQQNLPNTFKKGLDLYNELEECQEPSNSIEYQIRVKQTMKLFEDSTRMVSLADVFSDNETFDEVTTGHLQYFLLPALLGTLCLKLTTGERKDNVEAAEIYFKDYLKRCNNYKLSNYEINDKKQNEQNTSDNKTEIQLLENVVNTRATKIQKFHELKELKANINDLKKNIDNEHADDEIKREYFLTMIKLFIYQSIDELNSIEMEKPILEHMAKVKKDNKQLNKMPPPKPLKPIIITKNEIHKVIYGAGYPSLPTMTVQEFYDKRIADGIFPDPNKKSSTSTNLQQTSLANINLNDDDSEQEKKEKLVENDDENTLETMRQMDEFKDEHRRGWGNRMNRS